MLTKAISNIREGSAFGDVIDPEIKSAKGSEQKAKKDTSLKQSYTIKEERKAVQLRFVAKKIYGTK